MNERVQELAKEASRWYLANATEFSSPAEWNEKFAELIVKECADISEVSFHNGSAGYLAILNHFGVEQ
jgi:hypothetical protein